MREAISKLPVISLFFALVSFIIMITTPPLNTAVIDFATFLDIVGLLLAIISLFNPNCKKVCAILAIAFCITSFTVKSNLDNRRNNGNIYDYTTYRDPILDINSYFPNIITPSTNTPSTTNSSMQSENTTSDNEASDNMTSDNTTSDNTTSNNTSSDNTSSDNTVSNNITLDNTNSNK